MANVHDYLMWRGDIALDERPFNDVDNIVLSLLSYLDFTGIVPGEETSEKVSLSGACRRLLNQSGGDVTPYVRSFARVDTTFVRLVANSRRFGSAQLCAYVDKVDQERALQFAALQIDLANGETYVAFRGTDNTLVGWREDLMLSFEVTEAQREADTYLRRVFERTQAQQRPLRVGGHSKGGNLAEYAAVCCTDEQRERILRVYSNDGPGMAPEVMPKDGRTVLGERLRRIVPSYSIVGMFFARPDDPRIIVESTGTGIGQHDPTTWQVMRTGVKEVLELQPNCVAFNQTMASWMNSIELSERKRVTNELFDALGAGGATHFDELLASPAELQQALRALGNTDERTRNLALAFLGEAVESSMGVVRKAAQETLDQWKRSAQVVADDAARLLQVPTADIRIPMKRLGSGRFRGK